MSGDFLRKFIKFLLDAVYATTIPSRVYALRLVREARRAKSIMDLVDVAFNVRMPLLGQMSIRPFQVPWEIRVLLGLLWALRPKRILEIGTASGGTLFLFSQIADPNAIIISVDLPGGPFGGGYPEWKIPLYKSFKRYPSQEIFLIRADSHDTRTLDLVKKILDNHKLDFLFIDGDHTYEGVKKDFEMYSPLVRRGGLIAFHDIVPGPQECVGGVPRFWSEIKQKYSGGKIMEIVKDWRQGGYGIGVLVV